MEDTYLRVLVHWYKYRRHAPRLIELGNLCRPRKSATSVRSALLACESKGYVSRDTDGRFVVIP